MEVSVDTHIGRRNTSRYQRVRQDGVELLVSPDLSRHASNISIELKRFLFLNHLKAEVELTNGLILGPRGAVD